MKLPNLKDREQLLLAVTISVIALGGYAWLRFVPAHRVIADLTQSADATEQRLLTTSIPEEPGEDMEKLEQQLDEQERMMGAVRAEAEALERRLAPMDSHDAIMSISQLARQTQLRVRVNEPFKTSAAVAAADAGKTKPGGKKKAKASPAPKADNSALVMPPASAGWMARMAPGTVFYRPMQRLELEGSYLALRQFIHGLETLPYQITVVRLTVEKMPVPAPPGYPQSLLAELVLAL